MGLPLDLRVRQEITWTFQFVTVPHLQSFLCLRNPHVALLRCGSEDIKMTEPAAHLRPKSYKLFLAEPLIK
jgi:hypothetical protein